MIALACPLCRSPLEAAAGIAHCRGCAHTVEQKNGIWRMLRPDRVAVIENFLVDYTRIRLAEGRGSNDAEFYRNLPECPPAHPMAWQWRFHRQTWKSFRNEVLRTRGTKLRVLDLGAGTGWLSNRLARLGHEPCAVDLSCNGQDGLEASRHFAGEWLRLQAEFDRLPLADASVDVAVFNASLHYSSDYSTTLKEALRVLVPGGWLAVLEAPVYEQQASGQRMVQERREAFLERYGTASDSLQSIQFLTWDGVSELGRTLGLNWNIIRPWYGVRWRLRPWIARARNEREPSQFPILVAVRCRRAVGDGSRTP